MSELKDGSKNEPSFFLLFVKYILIFGGLDTLDLNKRR